MVAWIAERGGFARRLPESILKRDEFPITNYEFPVAAPAYSPMMLSSVYKDRKSSIRSFRWRVMRKLFLMWL